MAGAESFPHRAHPIRAWDETAGRKKDYTLNNSYNLVIFGVFGLAGAAAFFMGKDQPTTASSCSWPPWPWAFARRR